VRPQAVYFSQPAAPADGDTVKLPGLGAVLYGGKETGWPIEGNCGDCPVFSAVGPAAATATTTLTAAAAAGVGGWLVGNNFHTGKQLSKVDNSFGLATLTPDPRQPLDGTLNAGFVGLGVCTPASAACAGHPDGALALVGYAGGTDPPYLLAVLGLGLPGAAEVKLTGLTQTLGRL
jgi:hypothetical protein